MEVENPAFIYAIFETIRPIETGNKRWIHKAFRTNSHGTGNLTYEQGILIRDQGKKAAASGKASQKCHPIQVCNEMPLTRARNCPFLGA